MSDSKRYYWLRLKDDFFNSDDMKLIEKMPNGYKYIIFWQKLLLKAIQSHEVGILRYKENIPYTPSMLATVTGTDEDTVKGALDVFVKMGMIGILPNGELWIEEAESLVGSETKGAERKRLYRQKLPQIEHNPKSGTLSQNCPREKEIEIESEKESYKEKKKKVSPKGDHQKIISLYKSLYENRFNLPVAIDNKERAAVKRLLSSYSAAEIEKNLKIYMASDDKFWLKQGLTLSYFQVAIKSLRVKQSESKRPMFSPNH